LKVHDPNLKPQHRMPRVFGAAPGPRNVPKDKQHLPNNQVNLNVAATMLTDAGKLAELLPDGCSLDGEPLVTVNFLYLSNIGWLAGRGYTMIGVSFPIAYDSPSRGRLTGGFMPVVWENMADPILTGREELGFAKLYADIPAPIILGDAYRGSAGWDNFRFLDIDVDELKEVEPTPPPLRGHFHHKYVPRSGDLTQADVDYLEYADPAPTATGYGGMALQTKMLGRGRFRFHSTCWEEMPFQYPIINALADLPVVEWRGGSLSISKATGAIGDPSGGALAQID
jgi:hypothetical protein